MKLLDVKVSWMTMEIVEVREHESVKTTFEDADLFASKVSQLTQELMDQRK